MSKLIEAIYSPDTGRIACVLLQAVYGASQEVARIFSADDWDTAPRDTMLRMSATKDQWKQIAAMPIAERVAKWKSRSNREEEAS